MRMLQESSGDFETINSSRWDKLKPWSKVRAEIEESLLEPEKFDHNITLSHGPQLLHTMRHSNPVRCMTHYTGLKGEVFTTHGCHGSCSHISIWTLETDNTVSLRRFELPNLYSHMIHVTKHKVYLTFSEDMTVRIFTEPSTSSCKEIGCHSSLTSILCFTYNKEEDEVLAGGRGGLDRWKVTGSGHAAKLKLGRKFNVLIGHDQWLVELKLIYKHKLLLALCQDGIYFINYQMNKQIAFLNNWLVGSWTCFCPYNHGEYIVTGSDDGSINVWSGGVFTKVHEFCGQIGRISSLDAHHQDPFIVSSSQDGSVYIWRMDNFQKYMRVDLGEKIYTMQLLGDEELFCQTEREIHIYTLNQFFTLFAPVESSIFHLCRLQGNDGHPNRVLASTQDGSVRFFSPSTGATVTICYPMPSFQVLTCFAYNNVAEKLYTLLDDGDVLIVNCKVNPCKALEILQPYSTDEAVECLLSIKVRLGVENELEDDVILAGLRNGQISLIDASLCSMTPIQAHKGYVSHLESIAELDDSGTMLQEHTRVFISGGSDNAMKFWHFFINCEGFVFLTLIKKIDRFPMPTNLKVYHNRMAVVTIEKKSVLQVYKIERIKDGCKDFNLVPYSHTEDYDHTDIITALDMCPALQLFATASKDGLLKIWDSENYLVREMDFRHPLFGMCFANVRGDLIIGFQTNLVVVPLINYLMYDQLEDIVMKQFEDDYREKPISYNHGAQPWFDPNTLPKYPTDVNKRRAAKVKSLDKSFDSEQLIKTFDPIPSSVDVNKVMITPAERALGERCKPESHARRVANARYGCARALSLSLADDAQVEKIRRQSLKLKSFKDQNLREQFSAIKRSNLVRTEVGHYEPMITPFQPTIDNILTHAESANSILTDQDQFGILMELLPWERELLKKDPIIAPDGFIPNSVVRKRVNYVPPPMPTVSPFRLKSAPDHDPRFLPDGWSEKENEPEFVRRPRVFSSSSEKPVVVAAPVEETIEEDVPPVRKIEIPVFQPLPVKEEKKPKPKKQKEKVTEKFELKKYEFTRPNLDLDIHKKKTEVIEEEEAPPSPTTMIETLPDTDEVTVDTSTSDLEFDPRDSLPDILLRLLEEPWFPECEITTDAILLTLINLLASDDPFVFASACGYITELYHTMNLGEKHGDLIEELLLKALKSPDNSIVQSTLVMIRQVELKSPKLMMAVLPILLSEVPELRAESMLLVNTLAGVNCQDGLRLLMVDLGIIKSLDLCQSEQEALAILREKLGIPEKINVEEHEDRVVHWVGASKPGIYEKEKQKIEKKTRQEALVRRQSLKAEIQESGQSENRSIDDSSPEDDMWQQKPGESDMWQQKPGESDTEDEVSRAPRKLSELPQSADPIDKPQPKRKEKKKRKKKADVTDYSTRVPNVSRVSVYKESSSSTYTPVTPHTIEYWKSPSTISDDLYDYYSPDDDYSEIFTDEESRQEAESNPFKEYRIEKAKHARRVIPDYKKKQIKFFRPKLPNFGSYLEKKLKCMKCSRDTASTKRGYYKPRATKRDGRREKAQFKDVPSERLKQYAKLDKCMKVDKDFLKKALSSQTPESSDQRRMSMDKDFLHKALSSKTPESSDRHSMSKDGKIMKTKNASKSEEIKDVTRNERQSVRMSLIDVENTITAIDDHGMVKQDKQEQGDGSKSWSSPESNKRGSVSNRQSIGIESESQKRQSIGVESESQKRRSISIESESQKQQSISIESESQKQRSIGVESESQKRQSISIEFSCSQESVNKERVSGEQMKKALSEQDPVATTSNKYRKQHSLDSSYSEQKKGGRQTQGTMSVPNQPSEVELSDQEYNLMKKLLLQRNSQIHEQCQRESKKSDKEIIDIPFDAGSRTQVGQKLDKIGKVEQVDLSDETVMDEEKVESTKKKLDSTLVMKESKLEHGEKNTFEDETEYLKSIVRHPDLDLSDEVNEKSRMTEQTKYVNLSDYSDVDEVGRETVKDDQQTVNTAGRTIIPDTELQQVHVILKKMLKRQEIGVKSLEERNFVEMFTNYDDNEIAHLADQYTKKALRQKESVIETYKNADFMNRALLRCFSNAHEVMEEKEEYLRSILHQEDSGINGYTSGDTVQSKSYKKQKAGRHIDENYLKHGLSHQDSGITRDMSDSSTFSHGTHPGANGGMLKYDGILSPVKSCSNIDDRIPTRSRHGSPVRDKKWQTFLETPSATERKRMDRVKRDYEKGNIKSMSLPPIRYFKDGPTSPGEAGLRVLHTVQFDKEKYGSSNERHRVQPMEARLSYHTQSQRSGQVEFGALKMKWTTEVPRTRGTDNQYTVTPSTTIHKHTKKLMAEDESDFVWDHPLPPAPPRASLQSSNNLHAHYCQQYRLAKKKLHHYTSDDLRKFSLPQFTNMQELFKRYGHVTTKPTDLSEIQKGSKTEFVEEPKASLPPIRKKLSTHRPNMSYPFTGSKINLPPISLNQLISGIRLKPVIMLPEI